MLEHGVASRLTNFLLDIDALSDRQYAYRSGRSTTLMVREVLLKILEASPRHLTQIGLVRLSFCLIITVNFYYTYMHSGPCYQE